MSSLLAQIIPLARASALAAGAAVVLIVVSTIGVALGGTWFATNDTLQAAINIGIGALLVALGIRAMVRPPRPHGANDADSPPGAGRAFLAGAGAMAANLTTFALHTPALAAIAASGLPLGQRGLDALTILVITLMVAWVPLVLAANSRWTQVVLGLGFGARLIAAGAVDL
jgi:threonine/homoserine/homoserine lactone efflux protein